MGDKPNKSAESPVIHKFAESFVARVLDEADVVEIYSVLNVRSQVLSLPDDCWLFMRIIEWLGSARSGSWQYYENVDEQTFTRTSKLLNGIGMDSVVDVYEKGMLEWKANGECNCVDDWLDANADDLQTEMVSQLCHRKMFLANGAIV